MGTKSEPGKFDCHDKAGFDEPLFMLLARDSSAPLLIELWAALRELDEDGPTDKTREAREVARAMRAWRGTAAIEVEDKLVESKSILKAGQLVVNSGDLAYSQALSILSYYKTDKQVDLLILDESGVNRCRVIGIGVGINEKITIDFAKLEG